MDSIIYDLWEEFTNFGYMIRKSDKDGIAGWKSIMVLIPKLNVTWIEKSKVYFEKLVELGVNGVETTDESIISTPEWRRNHYLIQHGRIIMKNPEGNLERLLQIAYNAGQFRAELEKNAYPIDQLKYYLVHDLNKVTSYIEKIDKIPNDALETLQKGFKPTPSGTSEPKSLGSVTEAAVTSETPAKISSYINFTYSGGGLNGRRQDEPLYRSYLREYIRKLKY
jgi:hypothetical protein